MARDARSVRAFSVVQVTQDVLRRVAMVSVARADTNHITAKVARVVTSVVREAMVSSAKEAIVLDVKVATNHTTVKVVRVATSVVREVIRAMVMVSVVKVAMVSSVAAIVSAQPTIILMPSIA